jgi:hypothetical protein
MATGTPTMRITSTSLAPSPFARRFVQSVYPLRAMNLAPAKALHNPRIIRKNDTRAQTSVVSRERRAFGLLAADGKHGAHDAAPAVRGRSPENDSRRGSGGSRELPRVSLLPPLPVREHMQLSPSASKGAKKIRRFASATCSRLIIVHVVMPFNQMMTSTMQVKARCSRSFQTSRSV